MRRLFPLSVIVLVCGCTQLSPTFVQSQRSFFEKSAKPHMLRDAAAHPEDAQQINDSLAVEDLNLAAAEKSVGIAPTTQP